MLCCAVLCGSVLGRASLAVLCHMVLCCMAVLSDDQCNVLQCLCVWVSLQERDSGAMGWQGISADTCLVSCHNAVEHQQEGTCVAW